MGAMTSQTTNVSIVYSTVCSGADQTKHQSSASLAFVRGIHRWPMNSTHKGPIRWKMFPFDDVIMLYHKMLIGVFSHHLPRLNNKKTYMWRKHTLDAKRWELTWLCLFTCHRRYWVAISLECLWLLTGPNELTLSINNFRGIVLSINKITHY